MYTLLLVFAFIAYPGYEPRSDRHDFAYVEFHYASEAECLAHEDWWTSHESAEPRHWDQRWELAINHGCRASGGESAPPLVS